MARTWSTKEDVYLLAQQHDVESVAKKLERSPDAVKRRLRALLRAQPGEPISNGATLFVESRANRRSPVRSRSLPNSVVTRTPATINRFSGKGNPYAATKTGYRADLGIIVRSGWEANVLRVLQAYKIRYEFEPKIFTFPIKRGTKAYTPDIYLPYTDEWIEVKGYLDKRSMTKLRRFKRYYPREFAQLTMIIGRSSKTAREFCTEIGVPTVLYYEDFSKAYKSSLPLWEGR